MSGIDRVVFTLLEQLTSTDGNRIAQYAGNSLLDALRSAFTSSLDFSGAPSVRAVVLGGLSATRTSGGVDIAPGVLLQPNYAGAGTAPGVADSQAQLGRLVASASVPISLPVSDAWHLVQARVTEQTLTDPRLHWNTSTDQFDPATPVPVGVLNVVEFSVKVGGADVPLPDIGWCAIAAVFVASSGTAAASDVVDVRPLATDQQASSSGEEVMLSHSLLANYGSSTFPSTFLWNIDVDLIDRAGRRLFARANSASAFPLNLDAIKSPGLVLANSTWYYLYLCRWSDCAPRGAYTAITSQGVLVLSDVAPSVQGTRHNGSALLLPSPWNAYQVPVGQATCIGAVLSDVASAVTLGFRGMSMERGRVAYPDPISASFYITVNAAAGAALLPKNCRRAYLSALCDGSSGATLFARFLYPQVSPVRRATAACQRSISTLLQGYEAFDVRGISADLIYLEPSNTGITFGFVREMEF